MRDFIVAGNWKMNKTFDEGIGLVRDIEDLLTPDLVGNTKIVVSPPTYLLTEIAAELWESEFISIAAQNCHQKESGAFTGEVSAPMLKSIEVDAVILGHSERRQYFNETNAIIGEKVKIALENRIIPIFCCGELLEERQAGEHFNVVKNQIEEALFDLSAEEFSILVIAYEPVWAIGTGETATSAQAQEMHLEIRNFIAQKYGNDVAQGTSILYGGSCNPKNAEELFANPDVDGGLIGGASLKAEDFTAIVKAMHVKK